MLLKSIALQPFTPYGYQYVKFLLTNSIKRRHIFGEVIKFAIMGHHFHTITQETLKIEKVSSELDEGVNFLTRQISQYSSQVAGNSKEALTTLWRTRKELLTQARKHIRKIHIDFRHEINVKYLDVAERLKHLLKTYETNRLETGMQ
jgi:hypothetical protein